MDVNVIQISVNLFISIADSDAHSPEKLAREANLLDAPFKNNLILKILLFLRSPGQDFCAFPADVSFSLCGS